MAWLKGIFTALATIKEVAALLKKIIEKWDKYQDSKIDKHYQKKEDRINRLEGEIETMEGLPPEERNDEKLREMHDKLRRLNSRN